MMLGADLAALTTVGYTVDATRSFLASSLPKINHTSLESESDSDEPSVTQIACVSSAQPLIAVQLNNTCVRLLDLDLIKDKLEIRPSDSSNGLMQNGVTFSTSNPFHLWVGDTKGVGLYDVRMHRSKPTIWLTSAENEAPLTCFDVNSDESLLVAGCEMTCSTSSQEPACFLVWDVRSRPTRLRDSYADSHTEEVSVVKFQPTDSKLLATGGMDGLVNIFDLSEATEDDALQTTLKMDSTPQRIRWDASCNDLIVICEDGSLQVVNDTDVDPLFALSPASESDSAICSSLNGNGTCANSALASSAPNASGDGSVFKAESASLPKIRHWGNAVDAFIDDEDIHVVLSTSKGIVTIWRLDQKSDVDDDSLSSPTPNRLTPTVVSVLHNGGFKDRLRSVCRLPLGSVFDNSLLITGADDGILCVWKENGYGTNGTNGNGYAKVRRESGSSTENGHPITPLKRVRTLSTNSTGNGNGNSNVAGHHQPNGKDRRRNPSN